MHSGVLLLCFSIMACLLISCCFSTSSCSILHVVSAASDNTDKITLATENVITASISRRLAYPDFRDDEKAGAITLLGSAEINKHSGTINIPATSTSRPDKVTQQNVSSPNIQSRSQVNSTNIQPALSARYPMAGRALYSFPFRMMDPVSNTTASFHTTFSFRVRNITDKEVNSTTRESGGADGGLTFLVVPDELTVGRSGGWLGMLNGACDQDYKPFAVEFDMFKNEVFQDPNDHHVGINYGSIISHRTADIADAGISLHDGDTARAWISYDSFKHVVDVRLAKDGSEKPEAPLLTVPLDLSDIFREYMFVGFSGGTTGNMGHSILSWHFSSDSIGRLRFPKQESCVDLLLPRVPTPSRKAPSAFIIFCLVILIIGIAVLNFACIPYKRRGDETPAAVKLARLAREKPRALYKPRKLPIAEVLEASRFFNETEVLGSGNNGTFYRGVLMDSSPVAIKRLSSSYLQHTFNIRSEHRKLEKDVDRLAQVYHPNIVPLQGWCIEKGEVILVYEYMQNGSLDQWLFSEASAFPWIRRYKIVKELAAALAFLHSGLEKPVVHRNVKLSNVLLDTTFRAKLGDFGLSSKVCPAFSTVHSAGTNASSEQKSILRRGLALSKDANAPRSYRLSLYTSNQKKVRHDADRSQTAFASRGCIFQARLTRDSIRREAHELWQKTEEDDVHSFGEMLLQIVSARGEEEEDEVDVVEWVWGLHEEGRILEAIDENLRLGPGRYYCWEEEAVRVLKTGLLCTLHDAAKRPSMEVVGKYLHGEIPLPQLPAGRFRPSLATSKEYSGIVYPHGGGLLCLSTAPLKTGSLSMCLP